MKYRLYRNEPYKDNYYYFLESSLGIYYMAEVGYPIKEWFRLNGLSLARREWFITEFNNKTEVIEYIKKLKLLEEFKQ